MFKIKKRNIIHAAVFVLFLFILSGLTPATRVPALNVLKFPLTLLTLIGREAAGIVFFHRNMAQNERLKKEIGFLTQKLNAAAETQYENKRLKDLLSFKQASALKVVAARVIARSADNWSSVVIADKGSRNGVKRGFAVIDPAGLVGRVAEVSAFTSKIILINDPNLGVSAMVQRSRQEGLVSGTLGRSLIMKYLPKDADIEVSDMVISSGLTEVYPKGLLIGSVTGIGEEFSGLSRYAVIRPVVDLSSIEEVLIVIP
ncbi:MAG: rod shape-determining protein MreC [Candidatus Omnitrophica bacterium]|nr:rod shape-determining protein MreC [Candidatus Omnitrophota bacterium]MDD5552909.1 rod shape-determining protein MreC [Candidatus Omnitrophota bacterium]